MAHLILDVLAKKQRYNITSLGKDAGVNRNTTAKYWNNATPVISFVTLGKYARVLGVKITDMIVEDEDTKE